jgi:uncharacterized membrane protein
MNINISSNRLHSLDALRGFIMVLLALESTMLYDQVHKVLKANRQINSFVSFVDLIID